MKSVRYQKRFYRDWVTGSRLAQCRITVEETDVLIYSDTPVDRAYCRDRIARYRRQIKAYIARDERFLTSLKPIAVERGAAAIVRDMAAAARRANVGPMAAVAGAIAQRLGRDLLRHGCRDVIVENGGDIFLKTSAPVSVGVFAGASALSGRLRLRLDPAQMPCGICASSGTVGHSLSFGCADAAVIISASAALADAVATAAGNRVLTAGDFQAAVRFARAVRGVTGVLIIVKNAIASWGSIMLIPSDAGNNSKTRFTVERKRLTNSAGVIKNIM
jgi:hypothetical protein